MTHSERSRADGSRKLKVTPKRSGEERARERLGVKRRNILSSTPRIAGVPSRRRRHVTVRTTRVCRCVAVRLSRITSPGECGASSTFGAARFTARGTAKADDAAPCNSSLLGNTISERPSFEPCELPPRDLTINRSSPLFLQV